MPDPARGSAEALLRILSPATEPGSLGRLGDYEVLALLGRGGMGVVFRARDTRSGKLFALKMLMPHLAARRDAQRRFEREARAVAAISHENVVEVHGVRQANGVKFLVMQYVDGGSLQDRLCGGPPFEVPEIVRIARETLAGLAAAHARGIVHRDVKPANILLESGTGRVKVSDFGLARAVDDETLTRSGHLPGTPLYMSPEQADGLPLDARSDLFSLGSALYALCTGRPPFEGKRAVAILERICEDTPPSIREINPAVPPWLEAFISRLLAKDPKERFATAEAAAEALARQEVSAPGEPAPAAAKDPAPARRWWGLWGR